MRSVQAGTLFIAVMGWGNGAFAQWEVFDMSTAGFPSNTVKDIVVEPGGNAWVATDWGLCRLEAGAWTVLQTSNSGLPDNVLRSLAFGHDGRLWVGTSVGGVAVFDGQDWEVFNTLNSPLPDDQVNAIHVDQQGWVWLGTVSGLACYTGTEWRIYDASPQSYNGRILNGNHILSIDSRSDGLMALGTLNGGFHFLSDTAVHFFTTFNVGFFDNTQYAVLLDTLSNERWLACPAGGLVRQIGDWYGGTWFQYTSFNSGLPTNALVDMARDADGRSWIATQTAGLVRRDPDGSFHTYHTGNSGLPVNELECVTIAPDGAIWAGTFNGGAARFAPVTSMEEGPPPGSRLLLLPSVNDGRFRVDFPSGQGPGDWMVLDPCGRCVARGHAAWADGSTVQLPGIPPGTYVFRIEAEGTSAARRFVVH